METIDSQIRHFHQKSCSQELTGSKRWNWYGEFCTVSRYYAVLPIYSGPGKGAWWVHLLFSYFSVISVHRKRWFIRSVKKYPSVRQEVDKSFSSIWISRSLEVKVKVTGPSKGKCPISKSISSAICWDILNIVDDYDSMGQYLTFRWPDFPLSLYGTSNLIQNGSFWSPIWDFKIGPDREQDFRL